MIKLIEREQYLNKLIKVKNTPDIKVITGVRRCGKSKLLLSYIKWVEKNDKKANIIYLNLQETENEELLEYHKLHDYILTKYIKDKNNYLFIDEVQLCKQFEKAINSLHTKELFDIYVTGSNAFLLSSDLATLFTGRTFTIEVYPFSFKEFIKYYGSKNTYQSFDEYQKYGGFSGSYVYKSIEEKYEYIKNDIFETIVQRDIIQKYKIRNKELFNNLVNYMIDNISNLCSIRNIVNYISSKGGTSSITTTSTYIKHLCKSFIIYDAKRFDISGKRYLSSEDKYYLVDPTIKYAVLGTKNMDIGRSLENIVYIELLRRGYEVYIGKLYKKEVDFVTMKQNEKIYIQVSNSIEDVKTKQREIEPLLQIKDAYKKMIITRTYTESYDYEGIEIIDISDWLLS